MKTLKAFILRLFEKDIDSSASQVAYYFLVALFPFLFLLTKLMALFSISNDNILDALFFIFPESTYNVIYQNLETLTANTSSAIISISVLLALWSSSRATNALKKTFTYNYPVPPENLNFLYLRLFSVILTMTFAVLILFSFFALLVLNVFSGFLSTYLGVGYIANLLSMLVTFLIAVTDLVFIYMFLPPRRLKFADAIPGALFSTFTFIITSYAFSYYVNNLADFSRLYGALGSVVVLMLWLYICAYVIIIGGELNNFIMEKRQRI